MLLTIVPLYAGVLALVYAVLTINAIKARRQYKVAVGAGEDIAFTRIVRVHGNFSEYAPFILFLLALIELQVEWPIFIHVCGMLLVISRVIHALGVVRPQENFRFRVSSMAMTIILLLVLGGVNIYLEFVRFFTGSAL